jgi:predicted hotdog family 3-hydroxylacyl-ACP dehydratase
MSAFPPISELVPHTGAMVLLDAMLAWEPGRATCAMRVREGAPLVEAGRIETPLLIEPMAQSVAACLGYEAACKRFDAFVPSVPAGDTLVFRVSRTRGNATLSHFECAAEHAEGGAVASALLTLFHADQPPD